MTPFHALPVHLRALVLTLPSLALLGCGSNAPAPTPFEPQTDAVCVPGGDTLAFTGTVARSDAKQYRLQPFDVAPGTTRIELAYGWQESAGLPATPLTGTTLDLGLYDQRGIRDGFRGWSGSRQGRLDQGQPPVFIQADAAERGYMPGAIESGLWHAELGVAAVSPQGAEWRLEIRCSGEATAGSAAPDPVDATHIARGEPGWYHGDLHMHAFHSQPNGPSWEDFIAQSRAAGLDFLMVTEYVTGQHWKTLGSVARAHPDLLIVPGREIITYFGHANTHGETPGLYEYRQGFEDVSLGDIQKKARAMGALFQISHPTFFPPPLFENLCRGCFFQLGDEIDWDAVDTIEVLTGPVITQAEDIGLPLPVGIENPFMQSAIDLWEEKLLAGHRITAVSGSDSKGVEAEAVRDRIGYGSSATAVQLDELSRDALFAALRAGRAYIRTRGVDDSPELRMTATAGNQSVTFGGTLASATATLRTEVLGGEGQRLRYYANGRRMRSVAVNSDPFVHEITINDLADAGPLGTFWRVETADLRARTTIGNPVFLKPRADGTNRPQ
ncbi:MAG: CehA/McbA family metallohydrolase [Algiphilus sp.]|nr:CehA/McbA family metallohydrolase [Algiphilus sp.]